MQRVYEYQYDTPSLTRLWITVVANSEIEELDENIVGIFVRRAETSGLRPGAGCMHNEGDNVWAFGIDSDTTRIAGYFHNPKTCTNFIIGGVWSGKSGKGNARPLRGDVVVERIKNLRKERVEFVYEAPPA